MHSWFAGGAQDPSAEVLFVSGGRNGDQREGAESSDGTQEGHEGIYREIVPHSDDLLLIALCYAGWHVPNQSICQLFQVFFHKQIHSVLNVKLIINDSNHAKSYKVKTTTIFVIFTNKFTETS